MARQKPGSDVLDRVFAVIQSRKGGDTRTSHTARLLSSGKAGVARKLGEEALETIAAALTEPKSRIVSESADLLFHLLVLWAASGLRPEQIWAELARREGTSGIAEKASRSSAKPKSAKPKGARRGLRHK